MGDRVRNRRRGIQGVTAAAKILQANRDDAPKPLPWHEEAWGFRDVTGELRFAELWLGNSLSRVKLIAAKRPEPGAQPVPVTDGPAAELVADLAGGPGGQAALNRAFAAQLMTPGVAYLVGQPGEQTTNQWGVHSADEIRLSSSTEEDGLRSYDLRTGDDIKDWRPLTADSLVVKVWRPHPRWAWVPDSPVRGALPILRELTLLTQHVEASATSRLAGAGILAIDSTVEFEEGWDAWLADFLATVTKPIKDRGVAAAYAPFPVRIPGPNMKDKLLHIMFNTPFDEHALKLRDEAIGRLATAMDMPKAALTGEQENHWGKWATTEEGITLHVEPNMEIVCDGLTKGYLLPGLAAGQQRRTGEVVTTQDERRLRVLREAPTPDPEDGEWLVWFDTSDLRVRPDRSQDTMEAYDRWEVDGDKLRTELGISEAKPPTGPDFNRRVWIQMLGTELAPLAIEKLGLATADEIEAARPAAPAPALPPGDQAAPEDDQALPDTLDEPPPSQDAPQAPPQQQAADSVQFHPGLAVVAACDGLVHRALEKAGNRLRNLTARQRATDPRYDQPPHLMHTVCNAARLRPLDYLLTNAWDRVPEVAAQLGRDPAELTAELDAYVRDLMRARQAHTWQALADYLAQAPVPQAAVS